MADSGALLLRRRPGREAMLTATSVRTTTLPPAAKGNTYLGTAWNSELWRNMHFFIAEIHTFFKLLENVITPKRDIGHSYT